MVPLNLSQCQVLSDGFICENCIVLVEGEYVDGVFWATKMGHPPTEPRHDSIVESIGYAKSDIFGSLPSESELIKTQEQELQHGSDGMFVILSDVHLDDALVMQKLSTLFDGYQHNDPLPIFVLMGNFTSRPLSFSEGPSYYTSLFDDLTHMIVGKYPRIAKEARFVFIPGPYDPPQQTGGNCLPRAPLANLFTKTLRRKLSHVALASNPCRIRFFTKELVFVRHSSIYPMEKFSILDPRNSSSSASQAQEAETTSTSGDDSALSQKDGPGSPQNETPFSQSQATLQDSSPSKQGKKKDTEGAQVVEGATGCDRVDHAIKTMLDQAHLCPVPLAAQPVYWQYDHSLRLFPLPDALIVAEQASTPAFCRSYKDCTVIHPGSFTANKRNKDAGFQFVAFYPVRVGRTKKDYQDANDMNVDDEDEQGESSAVEFSQID
jgi:DNA polymerase epsilon subunit 2